MCEVEGICDVKNKIKPNQPPQTFEKWFSSFTSTHILMDFSRGVHFYAWASLPWQVGVKEYAVSVSPARTENNTEVSI